MRDTDPDFRRVIKRSPLDDKTKGLLANLVDDGIRMKRTKNGLVIYSPDGENTVGAHFTPTNPRRTYQNLLAELRRAGITNKEK